MSWLEDYTGLDHLYDTQIQTEDGFKFPVHRVLLAMRSEYFQNLLIDLPADITNIVVPGIQGPTMQIVIEYIYNGQLNLTGHNIRDVLLAAYFLGIDKLLDSARMIAIRNLTTANCVSLFLAATRIQELGILKACSRFIEVNFEGVVRDPESKFEDLPVEYLDRILALDSVNILQEDQIWTAIVFWINKDIENRKIHLKNLISCVRFDGQNKDLSSAVTEHPLVKNNPCVTEIRKIIFCHSEVSRHRVPEKLYFCTKIYISRSDYTEGIKVFLTYDANIDFWRNISSKMFSPDVVLHGSGSLVMMFETTTNVIVGFDIVSKEWSTISLPTTPRRDYNVVKLGNNIYVLGGLEPDNEIDTGITTVEKYNFESRSWEFVRPHYALCQGAAVTIDNHIYAIGTISNFYSEFLAAQIYQPDSDTWRSISVPQVYRRHFALVGYKNHLYILGGQNNEGFLKTVEVYDAASNTWRYFEDLPFPYFSPRAVVLKYVLYVYDNLLDDANDCKWPPVFWDESSSSWQVVAASSPFCDLHNYRFCVIEDPAAIMQMRKENRDPATKWGKSPFFLHLNA